LHTAQFDASISSKFYHLNYKAFSFEAVGWAAGRASGL